MLASERVGGGESPRCAKRSYQSVIKLAVIKVGVERQAVRGKGILRV